MTVTPWGWEFRVNTRTTGEQLSPSFTALKDGTFVAVWHDRQMVSTGIFDDTIRGQIFNADGSRKGDEFLVNDELPRGHEFHPSVAVLEDGRFVVGWSSNRTGAGDIFARIYTPDGAAGPEIRISSAPIGYEALPTVSALGDGFVVAYVKHDLYSSTWAQRCDVNGNRVGNEVLIGTDAGTDDWNPAVVGLKNGNYAVLYEDIAQVQSSENPWMSQLRVRSSNPAGEAIRPDIIIATNPYVADESRPSATLLADGRVVVVWREGDPSSGDGSMSAIKAQIFAEDGSAVAGPFVVNTTTAGAQSQPVVSALALGGFAVAFTSTTEGRSEVRAATFDATGALVSNDVLVNGGEPGTRLDPKLAALADGRFVVSWQDRGVVGSADPSGIRGQILDARSHGVNLAGTAFNDQYVGTRFNDTLRGDTGRDKLYGGDGSDILDGGAGADVLTGGLGDDTYYIDEGGDQILEAADQGHETLITTVTYSLGADLEDMRATGLARVSLSGNDLDNTLTGNDAETTIDGGAGDDRIDGGGGSDSLVGGSGDDDYTVGTGDRVIEAAGGGVDTVDATGSFTLDANSEVEFLYAGDNGRMNLSGSNTANTIYGNDDENVLFGFAGRDTLSGEGGRDRLAGGLLSDTLTGGAGQDIFVFDAKANKKTNLDRITDFSVRDDGIWLDNAVFKALGKKGTELKPAKLKKEAFWAGKAAHDQNDRLIYDKKKGALYYDEDGIGRKAQVQIASLTKGLKMTHADFFVI